MTIRRIDPDEPFTINGVEVTGRQLAAARQELSHRGVYNPRWDELSPSDQDTAAVSAGSWLRALADLVPGASDRGDQDDGPAYPIFSTYNQRREVLNRLPTTPDAAPAERLVTGVAYCTACARSNGKPHTTWCDRIDGRGVTP